MTRPDFLATVAALGWTVRGLARVLGRPEGTVTNWTRDGYSVPDDVAAWLERRLACLRADPPPTAPPSHQDQPPADCPAPPAP